ncbi:hypothetical protein AB0D34_25695 [Streptomyces sp. NPDC048420]|uniref:hypothetical protein n=1 Tax=Streptomyces sp. NPDC048420 TaxID=3155755 RepID=UPI003446C7D4
MALTFNLLAEPGTSAPASGPLTELARCLDQHFGTPAKPRYAMRDLDPPNRLVYLLDHEYTQRGLSWERLKGADAERAALLRAAAGRAGRDPPPPTGGSGPAAATPPAGGRPGTAG